MAHIELDIASDDPDRSAAELVTGTDVTFTPTGRRLGGGWPEYSFTGTEDGIIEVERRYWVATS